jgi:hypothetical protein
MFYVVPLTGANDIVLDVLHVSSTLMIGRRGNTACKSLFFALGIIYVEREEDVAHVQ